MNYYKYLSSWDSEPIMWLAINVAENFSVRVSKTDILSFAIVCDTTGFVPSTKDEVENAARSTMSNITKKLGL